MVTAHGALFAALLLMGCGSTGPNDSFNIDASFTVTYEPDVCTYLLAAKATQPDVVVHYAYELRIMRLVAPNTWSALVPLEAGRSIFTDSLGLSWPLSLGGKTIMGMLINFELTTQTGFMIADTARVFCEP